MRTKNTLFVIMAVMAVLLTSASLKAAPVKVTVDKITGKVEMKASDAAAWQAVKNGDAVPVSGTVRTGAGATCMLKWVGGNVVKLNALTTVKVANADKSATGKESSSLVLSGGKLAAHAKPMTTKDSSFSVKTPTAVAGVRGTDLYAEVSDTGASNIGVSAGNIEVESGGVTSMVEEGNFVAVEEIGIIPEPAPVPPEVMQELTAEFTQINAESQSDAASYQGETTSSSGGGESQGGETAKTSEAAGSGETAQSEEPAGETQDSADVGSSAVDSAMETQVLNDTVDASNEAQQFITGEVEVEINLGPSVQ